VVVVVRALMVFLHQFAVGVMVAQVAVEVILAAEFLLELEISVDTLHQKVPTQITQSA
jgi:hypothetical protein